MRHLNDHVITAGLFAVLGLALPLQVQALTTEEILIYNKPDRQQVLEEGAKKEGTVVLYSAMIVNQVQRPIADAFRKKYPFIDIKFWRGDSNQIVTKLNAESQANAFVADVVEGSGMSGGIGEAQIAAPFYSKYTDIMGAKDIAPDRRWMTTRYRYIALGYNTKLLKAEDAPKTYEDLLDPKWKGKMAWNASTDASGALITITSLRAAWGEEKAEAYLAKLGQQKIANLAMSNRAVVDRVIEGEYLIGVGISAHHPVISARKGAPSATVLLDPVPALNGTIQVMRGTKHPHAAMLLVDFMLSPEIQKFLQTAEYFPANPEVEPDETLKSLVPKNAGVGTVIITPDMLVKDTARSAQLFEKYFK